VISFRKRLALWLCRAAGLTEVAVHREQVDEFRARLTVLEDANKAALSLLKSCAAQTNSNTLMLKRWLEASPALQTVERAYATRKNGNRTKAGIILPPSADLRAFAPAPD
jgi:hypothetical protein